MTAPAPDRNRLRELFDLRSSYNLYSGGGYQDDPYPVWHRLGEEGPVLPGVLHELTGSTDMMFFHGLPYPDSPHFTVFDYDSCMTAYRNPDVFASSPEPIDLDNGPLGLTNSMLSMNGEQHKRYRGLVQPSFLPANGKWWIDNWISETVDLLIDGLVHDGHAELNVDFCAAIPCSPSPAVSACPWSRHSISGKPSRPTRRRWSTYSSRSSRPAARSRRTI